MSELFSKGISSATQNATSPANFCQPGTGALQMGLHAAPSVACTTIKLNLEVTLKLFKESLVGLGGARQAGSDGHQGNVPVHCLGPVLGGGPDQKRLLSLATMGSSAS